MFKRIWHHRTRLFVTVICLQLPTAYSQTIQTPETQAQRRSAKQQEQARQVQQRAPQVNLHPAAAAVVVDDLTLAVEPRCFQIARLKLDVPAQLAVHIRAVGASTQAHDNFRFIQDQLDKYAGRCIGREGITQIVERLTARILDKGYTTTRLGIPEQNLSSGTLIITLFPGVIHAIRFSPGDRAGSWKSAFPTRPGELLNLRDLEQGLEQMKRVPSQEVDMKILPGKQPGESDIEISLKHGRPWRLTATLDDSGALATGKLQAGFNFALDNILGLNDLFNIGLNNDADNKRGHGTRGVNAFYSMPWGNATFSLSGGTSYYQQRIVGRNQTFSSSGQTDNLEFKTSYLFHRNQNSKSNIQFRISKRHSRAFIDDVEIIVQRSNTALAELALQHKHNIGQAQINVTVAYRWGKPWFGGKRDAVNSPAGTPKYRYKLQTIDATLTLPFKLAQQTLSYSATFRAQNSNTSLYAAEWFSIGNRWTVRGFDGENSLGSEKGFYLRNEIDIPIANSAHTLYLGLDFGKVYGANVQNLVGDKLAGAIIGLRGNAFGGLSYDMFAGWPLYQPQSIRSQSPVLGISLSYQL